MNVLALDLGTRTGWALAEGGRIESGVQDFAPKRGESSGIRYLHFRRWLQETAAPYARSLQTAHPIVDLIVYEMPHLRGGAAATVLAGLQTRIEEFHAEHKDAFDIQPVHSATLKKWTTGKGRGDKSEMAISAHARGWLRGTQPSAIDDNEVDAICLLHYALDELLPKSPASAAPQARPS